MWSMDKKLIPSAMYVVLLMKKLHIMSECSKLAQKEYKQVRHDNSAKMMESYIKNGGSIK